MFKAASPRVRQLEHNRVFSPRRDAEESVVLLDDLLHVILEHSQPLWIWFVTTAVPDLEVVRSTVHNPCDWGVGIDFHDAVKKGVSVGRAEGPTTPPVALFALLEGGQLSGSVPGFRCGQFHTVLLMATVRVNALGGPKPRVRWHHVKVSRVKVIGTNGQFSSEEVVGYSYL